MKKRKQERKVRARKTTKCKTENKVNIGKTEDKPGDINSNRSERSQVVKVGSWRNSVLLDQSNKTDRLTNTWLPLYSCIKP